ncbi:MAG: FAD:protein FMN transferase [Spirochaetales bacterium]|nr:FAD:protein FMN transferase [Spirochaetales bacterium]
MSKNPLTVVLAPLPAVVALLAAVTLCSCQVPLHRETRLAMSTTLTVAVSGRERPDWDPLFEAAERLAWQFDHRYPEGPIGELNRLGAARPGPEVAAVLELALEVASASAGAFDPTVLPLTQLWSFDTGGRLPAPGEVLGALERVDYRRLQVDPSGAVSLPEGFGLDLGGIAKGAVVDSLARVVAERVGRDFLIDAGGDILLSGLKEGRKPWVIAIRHPRRPGALAGRLSLGAREGTIAVVTSGDYERYFEQDGRRYHHILDPRTGYPAAGPASVTVVAPSCALADALATAAFVLGPQRGLELLEQLKGVEGLILSEEDGRLDALVTSGFPLPVDALTLD